MKKTIVTEKDYGLCQINVSQTYKHKQELINWKEKVKLSARLWVRVKISSR